MEWHHLRGSSRRSAIQTGDWSEQPDIGMEQPISETQIREPVVLRYYVCTVRY